MIECARTGSLQPREGIPGLKILDNLFVVPDVFAHTYVCVDSDGVTLIDTGAPMFQKKILTYVRELGRSPSDIKRIILTHSDMDHVGGLASLHETSGARTYASRIEAQAIAAGKSSRRLVLPEAPLGRFLYNLMSPMFRIKPLQVDEIVSDGQILPVLGGLRVLDTPGHAPGHISLFAPAAGVLFCGDSLRISEQGTVLTRLDKMEDPQKARESVRRQAALGAHIVCAGHGPVLRNAEGKIP